MGPESKEFVTDALERAVIPNRGTEGLITRPATRRVAQRCPLGCAANPNEIAETIMFLASGRASYVNGAMILVRGRSVVRT